ncbi:MAG: MFS transporter [Planctomycetota bacterium]|jgi:MFS family permease
MPEKSKMYTPEGTVITNRDVRRGLRISIFSSPLIMVWFAFCIGIPLTMVLERLGASGFIIGMAVTVQQFAFVFQIPGALIADAFESRKKIWIINVLAARIMWFIPPLVLFFFIDSYSPMTTAWIIVITVAISSFILQISASPWLSWMADLVPGNERGKFWSLRTSIGTAAYMLAVLAQGWLLDHYSPKGSDTSSYTGFVIVFTLGAVFGIAELFFNYLVPEPKQIPPTQQKLSFAKLISPLKDRNFRNLTLSIGMWFFSIGLINSFSLVCLSRYYQATNIHLAYIGVSASISAVLTGLISGQILDRIGARAYGTITLILAPLMLIGWAFASGEITDPISLLKSIPVIDSAVPALKSLIPHSIELWVSSINLPQIIWIIIFINLVAGGIFAGPALVQISMSSALAPSEGKTMAIAVHWTVVGIIGALGPMAGGVIVDLISTNPAIIDWQLPNGQPATFFHILALLFAATNWFITVPVFMRMRRKKGELTIGKAVSRLFLANPMRAVNIYTINSPAPSHKKAEATRKLGLGKTAIAVSDLIAMLDDASSDVREEAAYALGSIGSPDAIDALIEKLEDPNSDLAPQIARSLRWNKDPRSVSALVRSLDTPDRETQSESARALGEIGDKSAAPSLLTLLKHSDDSKVISYSSEALARLGELAAIYDIIPSMKNTRNPVLKRSLAVTVGDLIGNREDFYKILSKENKEPGSEIERLLETLKKSIGKVADDKMAEEAITLKQMTTELQECFDSENYNKYSNLLFRLGIGMAALQYGVKFGGNAKTLIDELIWRDQRFGLGMWMLSFMVEEYGHDKRNPLDTTDALLGTYFLVCNA